MQHNHEWHRGMVGMGKRRTVTLSMREGAVCECGLVALPPMRADKRKDWDKKMKLPPRDARTAA